MSPGPSPSLSIHESGFGGTQAASKSGHGSIVGGFFKNSAASLYVMRLSILGQYRARFGSELMNTE
jgi:hypothetical protein